MTRYDDTWVKELADDARRRGGLVTSRFEDCKTVFDVLEVLDDIMWILPKEEQAKAKPPARSPLTADELRRLMPGVPDPALAALVIRAQLIAHPDHWRPRLVVNNSRVDASSSKLTAKQLRQAISLGVKLAQEEALFKLTMKAKQVAELDRRDLAGENSPLNGENSPLTATEKAESDRRRPRLVIDNTKIEPRQA